MYQGGVTAVRLGLTEEQARELYDLLTDDRARWKRALWPRRVGRVVVARLHIALREQQVRNLL
jgi:hypothetical protein